MTCHPDTEFHRECHPINLHGLTLTPALTPPSAAAPATASFAIFFTIFGGTAECASNTASDAGQADIARHVMECHFPFQRSSSSKVFNMVSLTNPLRHGMPHALAEAYWRFVG